jgi:hypothetical protein
VIDEDAWKGENPFYLLAIPEDKAPETVDLDRHGWLQDQGWIFRTEAELHLIRKAGRAVVFSVRLAKGEQGYYTARHIGIAGSGGQAETIAYGIGKKRADGNEDNLWVMPWGQVCSGNDVEYFALKGLKSGAIEV